MKEGWVDSFSDCWIDALGLTDILLEGWVKGLKDYWSDFFWIKSMHMHWGMPSIDLPLIGFLVGVVVVSNEEIVRGLVGEDVG